MCLPLFCGKSRSKPLIKFIPGPNRTGEKCFRLSGPAPGRPKKGETRDKAQDYRDECERVEVERRFSLAKRKCGMGLVTAKLRETAAHVIAMSVLVLNLRKIQRALLRRLAYLLEILAQNKNWALVQWILVNTMSTSSQKGTDNVEMAPLLTTLQKRKISPSTKIS